jgi:hypothetical protein
VESRRDLGAGAVLDLDVLVRLVGLEFPLEAAALMAGLKLDVLSRGGRARRILDA